VFEKDGQKVGGVDVGVCFGEEQEWEVAVDWSGVIWVQVGEGHGGSGVKGDGEVEEDAERG